MHGGLRLPDKTNRFRQATIRRYYACARMYIPILIHILPNYLHYSTNRTGFSVNLERTS